MLMYQNQLVNAPVPEITPEIVSSPESPVVSVIPLANSTDPDPLKIESCL